MRLRLALVLALVSGSAFAQEHDHMHMDHHDPATLAAPASKPGVAPLYTPYDLAFLQHMAMHHQQAIDMGALIEGRAVHPELIRFAGLVADAQRAEINHMEGLLEIAASRGLQPPPHSMHGDPPMAGMLSDAEMKALAAAKGPQFERLWLEGMMFHHEGGLAMARAQELRQAMDGRQPDQLAVMLDDILNAQRAEVAMMQAWLDAWGLAEPGDRRPPAVEMQSPPNGAAIPLHAPTTLFGVAVDDRAMGSVEVGIHDLAKDRWLHRDGSWGDRQAVPAELIGSGPSSAAFRLAFTPPSAGRYAIEVAGTDAAGKQAAASDAWTLEGR